MLSWVCLGWLKCLTLVKVLGFFADGLFAVDSWAEKRCLFLRQTSVVVYTAGNGIYYVGIITRKNNELDFNIDIR